MKILYFLPFILLSVSSYAQQSAKDILLATAKTLQSQSSISYKADFTIKLFNGGTEKFNSEVRLLRDPKDTILGGYVWIKHNDTIALMYDLEYMYRINSKSKRLTRYNGHAGEDWVMTNNFPYNMITSSYFLNTEALTNAANGPATLERLKDTVVSGIDCYKVRINYPDDEELTDHKTTLCISKTDKMPVLRYGQAKSQGDYEYKTTLIKDYQFNKLSKEDFNLGHPYSNYKRDTFVMRKPTPPLATGTKAPAIKGKHYQNRQKEEVVSLTGKVTLLDFWYMDCPHCIEAFPVIDKLYKKYKDQGLQVIGVDPVDSKRLAKMPQFLTYNTINYPIYITKPDITKSYSIAGFPIYYLIGKDGKVLFSTVGFIEGKTEAALTEAIEEALKGSTKYIHSGAVELDFPNNIR